MPHLIPATFANRIYDALVEHAGASPDDRDRAAFVRCHREDPGCGEYYFVGSLGSGGKLVNDRSPWRVSCFHADETPARLAAIQATNAALGAIWREWEGDTRHAVRVEVEWSDGVVERAEGEDAAAVWRGIQDALKASTRQGRPYRGPGMRVVSAGPGPAAETREA